MGLSKVVPIDFCLVKDKLQEKRKKEGINSTAPEDIIKGCTHSISVILMVDVSGEEKTERKLVKIMNRPNFSPDPPLPLTFEAAVLLSQCVD